MVGFYHHPHLTGCRIGRLTTYAIPGSLNTGSLGIAVVIPQNVAHSTGISGEPEYMCLNSND